MIVPCKDWPSAPASGGCGLDKGLSPGPRLPPRDRRRSPVADERRGHSNERGGQTVIAISNRSFSRNFSLSLTGYPSYRRFERFRPVLYASTREATPTGKTAEAIAACAAPSPSARAENLTASASACDLIKRSLPSRTAALVIPCRAALRRKKTRSAVCKDLPQIIFSHTPERCP